MEDSGSECIFTYFSSTINIYMYMSHLNVDSDYVIGEHSDDEDLESDEEDDDNTGGMAIFSDDEDEDLPSEDENIPATNVINIDNNSCKIRGICLLSCI